MKKSGGKAVRYNKWGYIFLIPFIVVYVIFQLIPLFSTIYNSFFENYMSGLTQVGPNFVGLQNYIKLFEGGDIWIYAKNTMILWIMCFVPQIFLSLLLGAWFSDVRLKLKGSRFFKTVIYLPNLIMASAFSMLFFTLFAESGPINSLLIQMGFITEPYKFLSNVGSTRGLIAFMNCLMWFGNTTILLMNEAATVNLFWEKGQMNMTLDDKVILEDENGPGPQFYVDIAGLQVDKGRTPGSYVFTGEQSFTDRQYGPVEVRIREGRYNAAGTVAVWLEIVWNENVYELDFQKGVRQWDFQSLKVKSSEKTIILKK